MMPCIICDGPAQNLICPECKEAILNYRNLYFTQKKVMTTTELDDQMFELMFKQMEVDKIFKDEFESYNPTPVDEIMEMLKEAIMDTVPKDAWIFQQPGRLEAFLKFNEKKFREMKGEN